MPAHASCGRPRPALPSGILPLILPPEVISDDQPGNRPRLIELSFIFLFPVALPGSPHGAVALADQHRGRRPVRCPRRLIVLLRWLPVSAGSGRSGLYLTPAVRLVLPRTQGVAEEGRGVTVDHVTIYLGAVAHPEFMVAALPCRRAPVTGGSRGDLRQGAAEHSCAGVMDQHVQVIDVLLSERRDLEAGRQVSSWRQRDGALPADATTDRAAGSSRALDELIPPRFTPSVAATLAGCATSRPTGCGLPRWPGSSPAAAGPRSSP
jgi:hypothetical protein